MRPVYEYTNYRVFLQDYYESKKASNGFTFRDFAEKAGMNSPSWLRQLIKGTKNLSNSSVTKVINALELKKKEAEYFNLIVEFTQAQTANQKNEVYQSILNFKKKYRMINVSDKQYEFYTKWYYPVIRSLVTKVDFGEDYSLLAKKILPKIKTHEAKKAVNLLKKIGFIEQDKSGNWVHSDSILTTGDEVNSLQIINFHKEMSKLAMDAHDRTSREKRDVSSLTLGVNEIDFELIKSKVQTFRKEILEIAKKSNKADRVYQLNFQLFPVSEVEDGKNGK